MIAQKNAANFILKQPCYNWCDLRMSRIVLTLTSGLELAFATKQAQ